jgi:hypothetical protein
MNSFDGESCSLRVFSDLIKPLIEMERSSIMELRLFTSIECEFASPLVCDRDHLLCQHLQVLRNKHSALSSPATAPKNTWCLQEHRFVRVLSWKYDFQFNIDSNKELRWMFICGISVASKVSQVFIEFTASVEMEIWV